MTVVLICKYIIGAAKPAYFANSFLVFVLLSIAHDIYQMVSSKKKKLGLINEVIKTVEKYVWENNHYLVADALQCNWGDRERYTCIFRFM